MKTYFTIKEIKSWRSNITDKKKIGFVPTMGGLHKGHIQLIRESKKKCDVTIVSIFLNPIQFNSPKDLLHYPKSFEEDKKILIQEEVDILFAPSVQEVYPNGFPAIKLLYPELMNKLCGAKRKGHFEGVLLIAYKLFVWIQPAVSFFGLKDYQQYLLISNMVNDLELKTKIAPVETVREDLGIACSSRNALLSNTGKNYAKQISQRLFIIQHLWKNNTNILAKELQQELQKPMEKIDIEYWGIYNSQTLVEVSPSKKVEKDTIVAIVGSTENVRLIDNIILR